MPEESRKSTAFAPVPQQSDLGDPKVFSTVLGVSMRSLFKALAEGRENEVPELVFSMTALLLDPSAFIQPQGWSASALAERFRSVLDDQLPDLSADLEHPAEAVAPEEAAEIFAGNLEEDDVESASYGQAAEEGEAAEADEAVPEGKPEA